MGSVFCNPTLFRALNENCFKSAVAVSTERQDDQHAGNIKEESIAQYSVNYPKMT
jgi:hypothetical protein